MLHPGNVGVGAPDLHKGLVHTGPGGHLDHQIVGAFDQAGGADARFQQCHRPGAGVVGDAFQYGQTAAGIAAAHTQQGGNFNTAAPAGVGDGDAFYILYNVAAAGQQQFVGLPAQHFAGQRPRVGDGNGLGTAHGGDQLAAQQFAVDSVSFFIQHKARLRLVGFPGPECTDVTIIKINRPEEFVQQWKKRVHCPAAGTLPNCPNSCPEFEHSAENAPRRQKSG